MGRSATSGDLMLQLDNETLQELLGTTSFQEVRIGRTHYKKLHAKVTYAESQGMRPFKTIGRTSRWIPEFVHNDAQLRSVILHTALNYIYRSKKRPDALSLNLLNVDRMARDKAARIKAIADGSEDKYWQNIGEYIAAVDTTGYVALLSAVAWRAWRNVPPWHDEEIGCSLAMRTVTVAGILRRLVTTARLLRYPAYEPRKDKPQAVTDEAIVEAWSIFGLTVDRIVADLHVSPQRVRRLLRLRGLFVWRKREKGNCTDDQIIAEWKDGRTVTQIMAKFSVARLRVVNILKAYGLHKKRRKVVTAHGEAEAQ